MEPFQAFDEKFKNCMDKFRDLDFSPEKAEILGVRIAGPSVVVDFFNRKILVSKEAVTDAEGKELTLAIKVLLLKYLLFCPDYIHETTHRLVTFREFSNAAPLFSSFTANTAKIIETSFSGNRVRLEQQCIRLGGTLMENASHDMSVRFRALYRIPIILNFNDRDKTLPAKACFLYHDNADRYLDLESLMITCTYLTGLLLQTDTRCL